MNRRNLFKFLGALPLLAVAPKAATSAWREMLDAGTFANFPGAKYEELGWYVGPNQVAKYRWVAVDEFCHLDKDGGVTIDLAKLDVKVRKFFDE